MQRRQFLKSVAGIGAGIGTGIGLSASGLMLAGCERKTEASGSTSASKAAGGEKPSVIRVGAMGAWGSSVATGYMGILQSQQLLEKEFEKDGTRIEWTIIDGQGPAQNEAIANGLIDFGNYGALPNIIGKARGLKTRILASYGYANSYLAVRSSLPAKQPADLKGYSFAADIGHIGHLTTALLLKQYDIDLKEVKLVKMGGTEAVAALAAGQVDAYLGGPTLFPLEQQGIVRIIYSSRGSRTHFSNFGAFVGIDTFTNRYPDATHRVLKSYLRAAHWVSQPENREAYFDWVARNSTTPIALLRRDFEGQDLRERVNPLIDEGYLSRYREGVAFCLENDLIRNTVDIDTWIDRKANQAALAELGLQDYWGASVANGSVRPA